MTFPLKEQVVYFEKLAERQHRIYPDACDIGIPFADVNLDAARKATLELMKFYGYTLQKWRRGKNVTMFVPYEAVEMDTYRGVNLVIGSNTDKKVPGGGFMSIDIYEQYRAKANIPSMKGE